MCIRDRIQDTRAFQVQYAQTWDFGLTWQWTYANSHYHVNSSFFSLNPYTTGDLDLQITQNLLQGFGSAVNGRNIRVQRNNVKVSDLQFLSLIHILGPCGGTSADSGMPTNAIARLKGGQMLHIKVQEMVFHPGHYRIALAVNSRDELPPDPAVTTRDTDKGPWSVSSAIASQPNVPVLADGLFVHSTRQTGPFETDVQLPNLSLIHIWMRMPVSPMRRPTRSAAARIQ